MVDLKKKELLQRKSFMDTNKEQYEALKKNVMTYFTHENSR